MILSCKCLNVTINGTLLDLDLATLNLSSEENDSFFKEKVGTVELGKITKAQPYLVQVKNVGNWITNFCINCGMYTHAISGTKDAAFVLFNKALLTDPTEIEELKTSLAYSSVFHIIVYIKDDDLEYAQKITNSKASKLSHPFLTGLSALHQQLKKKEQQEDAHTEEKVNQLYASLGQIKDQAFDEFCSLSRVLFIAQENVTLGQCAGTSGSSHIPVLASPVASMQSSTTAGPKSTRENGKKLPSSYQQLSASPMQISHPNVSSKGVIAEKGVPLGLFPHSTNSTSYPESQDTKCLFLLEGVEENHTETSHSEDETDTDDSSSNDEGIDIPAGESGSYGHHIVRSLPIPVPRFNSSYGSHASYDGDDERTPQGFAEMEASFQALARKVNGDDANIFGDLPRPRRSMNL